MQTDDNNPLKEAGAEGSLSAGPSPEICVSPVSVRGQSLPACQTEHASVSPFPTNVQTNSGGMRIAQLLPHYPRRLSGDVSELAKKVRDAQHLKDPDEQRASVIRELDDLGWQVIRKVLQELLGNVLTYDLKKKHKALGRLYSDILTVGSTDRQCITTLSGVVRALSVCSRTIPECTRKGAICLYFQAISSWLQGILATLGGKPGVDDRGGLGSLYVRSLTVCLTDTEALLSATAVSALLGESSRARLLQVMRPVNYLFAQAFMLSCGSGERKGRDDLSFIIATSGLLKRQYFSE